MRLRDRIGPVYSAAQIAAEGLDPATLIALSAANGKVRFPAAQFDVNAGRLEPRADVAALWSSLATTSMSTLGRWMWMTGPKPALDGLSPLQYLDHRGADDRFQQLVRSLVPQVLAA